MTYGKIKIVGSFGNAFKLWICSNGWFDGLPARKFPMILKKWISALIMEDLKADFFMIDKGVYYFATPLSEKEIIKEIEKYYN